MELAWMVPAPPSCPVLSAASSSTTSAPRISPRTIRSGRIRIACFNRSDMVIAPAPSTLAERVTRLTVPGWAGLSSAVSSMQMIRWSGATSPSIAASRVVLPDPVPPTTRKARRCATMVRNTAAVSPVRVPPATRSSSVRLACRRMRMLRQVPESARGGRTAWMRMVLPSSRVMHPSTNGWASSSRRPHWRASRAASRRTASSDPRSRSSCSSPAPRSIHTSRGPLTSTSVTPGRASAASSGPIPTDSLRNRLRTAMTSSSLITPACSRITCTTSGEVGCSGSPASTRCTCSSSSSCGIVVDISPAP